MRRALTQVKRGRGRLDVHRLPLRLRRPSPASSDLNVPVSVIVGARRGKRHLPLSRLGENPIRIIQPPASHAEVTADARRPCAERRIARALEGLRPRSRTVGSVRGVPNRPREGKSDLVPDVPVQKVAHGPMRARGPVTVHRDRLHKPRQRSGDDGVVDHTPCPRGGTTGTNRGRDHDAARPLVE